MRSILAPLAVLLAALVAAPSASQTPPAAPGDLLARMIRANSGLHSYQAAFHVDIVTHGFPYISPSLDGTAYYKQPNKAAIVFDTVPALASQFKKVYPQLEPPSEWPRLYDVAPVADDGSTAQLRLVRKVPGRVDHVDVTVDDKTAMVTGMTYFYKDNAGSIAFRQTYTAIDGNYVPKAQTGKVDIPHYSADVSSSFSNYKINVKIDDKVFAAE